MNLIKKEKNFMNTTITFKVVQNKETTVDILDAIEEGFGEFDRIVRKFTRFNQNSELSNLNRQSSEWVQVSEEFIWLIEYMLQLAKLSGGVFDPTVIDYLEVYGYDPDYNFSKLENPNLQKFIDKIRKERASWREIEIDKENQRVKLARNQRIDLGGIGKGYAIDCAFEKLKQVSPNFIIDAGGDIRASGRNEEGEKWRVGLKDKISIQSSVISRQSAGNHADQHTDSTQDGEKRESSEVVKVIGMVELDNEALACSGSWARKVKNFHHLINPKTGKPENIYRTVYIQAPTGIESDSWATTLFVGGESILEKIPNNFKVFTIKADGGEDITSKVKLPD